MALILAQVFIRDEEIRICLKLIGDGAVPCCLRQAASPALKLSSTRYWAAPKVQITSTSNCFNTGVGPVDISGWRIELWDSDSGSSFGGADGGSPYLVPDGVVLGENQFFLFANSLAQTAYSVNADVTLPDNAIENSSYTIVLRNAVDDVINTVFVTDGGEGDLANIVGA